ncbi:MAG TPA: hypothetical protein VGO99_05660 [Leifsonia sp.]|nr:hypothetical protein [Leifsonia sp.]
MNIPSASDLADLTDHRDDASVTIYVKSSPLPREIQTVQLTLKNLVADAMAQLEATGTPTRRLAEVAESLGRLQSDEEFWLHQAHALAIFAAPGKLQTYRLANHIHELLAVGDRFDVGPLLRSVSFANAGYVLTVTGGSVHLYELSADHRPAELELSLPSDLESVLEIPNHGGQSDLQRAAGATGQKIEQQRYCRLIQEAVLGRISDSSLPMILAATDDMKRAYRVINTYPFLLDHGIDVHPDSLTPDDLDARAREILDEHYRSELSEWREHFGTQRSHGRATSKLDEVARAATAAAIEELLFDMESTIEGSIDGMGVLKTADDAGPSTYNVVDEIAARVLRSGGKVRAVRNKDLVDGSPVAALLRFPV